MQSIIDLLLQNINIVWNTIASFLVLIAGFLISKKAILAGIYYCISLLQMFIKFLKRILSDEDDEEDKRPARKIDYFWLSDLNFKEALHKNQQDKEEEFYFWIQYLLKEKTVTEEQLKRLPLYSIFIQYSCLNTMKEKKQFAQILAQELRLASIHSHIERDTEL